MRKAMLVGLCGRSGSGKGYVSEIFAKYGIPSVDTDAVYRSMTAPADVLSPCMKELSEAFGDGVVNADNSLNRPAMRSLVFQGDRDALDTLNRITHRHILAETERIAKTYAEEGSPIVLIDAPLLYESGFDKRCQKVIAVVASDEKSVLRIMRRDGIDREAALARLKTQKTIAELTEKVDYVIENSGDGESMMIQIEKTVEALRALAQEYGKETEE